VGRSGARVRAGAAPRAVLFDMDDTIFDHSLTCRDALGRVRAEYDVFRDRPLDALWREYGRLLNATHTDVMLGRRTSEEVRAERFRRLARWAGHPVPPTQAVELSRRYREHYQQLRRPVPGAPEAVRRWHDRAQVGVVTNNTVAEQVEKIAFLGLGSAIDFLVTSEEVGVAKPDPRIFRAALDRAGVAPGESVMVGDSWASDIAGARATGLRALWFNRFVEASPDPAGVPEFRSFRAPRRFDRLVAPT
jgi:HAD superfamily hydrolase (TIGR01549 family)